MRRNFREKITVNFFVAVVCLIVSRSMAVEYSGGSGEPNDPYQIATAADLIALGEAPNEYDKHFILTADIDLDPNLPGRKVFDTAAIAPLSSGSWGFKGLPFSGVFDGNGHTISHLTIEGTNYVGLFGGLSRAKVSNLGLEAVDINGTGENIGSLAGVNCSTITSSYSTGKVTGGESVGGLVGMNVSTISQSYSTCTVNGQVTIGGLVGENNDTGHVTRSYSTGSVSGNENIGGLVGVNYFGGRIYTSYSNSTTNGQNRVGGLVGWNYDGYILASYSTGSIDGVSDVGGLVGTNSGDVRKCYSVSTVTGDNNIGGLVGDDHEEVDDQRLIGITTASFWDTETSGQLTSAGGVGKTTAEMQTSITFEKAGWGRNPAWITDQDNPVWTINQGNDYPRLRWENKPGQLIDTGLSEFLEGEGTQENPYILYTLEDIETAVSFYTYWQDTDIHFKLGFLSGEGTQEEPYLIYTTDEFYLFGICPYEMDKHFELMDDIDLSGITYHNSVIQDFLGIFDGNGHAIHNLTITGYDYPGSFGLGLFDKLYGGVVRNLGIVDVNITGSGEYVSGFVGWNMGNITSCYITGTVNGETSTGGLVGWNTGSITSSYCYCIVTADCNVGGIVGLNSDDISLSYSTGSVIGNSNVGGLVGKNSGNITTSYSTGLASGNENIGGLVGNGYPGSINASLWDIEASGQTGSNGGVGLTTAEMMDPYMLGLNGFSNDPNWVLNPGLDYPRLAWEGTQGQIIPEPEIDWLEGNGTSENPYQINTADQMILLGKAGILWDKSFVLGANIDLDPNLPDGKIFGQAVIPKFAGVFDGNNHTILNLVISGDSYLGFVGLLESGAEVKNLGVLDVNIIGSGVCSGSLAGRNKGDITACYSSGVITGNNYVGGLVGYNYSANITTSHSSSTVSGNKFLGGLVGYNSRHCSIDTSYSTGSVNGSYDVGGLVGYNSYSNITKSYSTGSVRGNEDVGGFVGENGYDGCITNSYSISSVNGIENVGGFVGNNYFGEIYKSYSTGSVIGNESVGGFAGYSFDCICMSFWDMQASGIFNMCGRGSLCNDSFGKTTAQMQTASTFLNAGWDFVDETENGTDDIWWIDEGVDYPRFWWETDDN